MCFFHRRACASNFHGSSAPRRRHASLVYQPSSSVYKRTAFFRRRALHNPRSYHERTRVLSVCDSFGWGRLLRLRCALFFSMFRYGYKRVTRWWLILRACVRCSVLRKSGKDTLNGGLNQRPGSDAVSKRGVCFNAKCLLNIFLYSDKTSRVAGAECTFIARGVPISFTRESSVLARGVDRTRGTRKDQVLRLLQRVLSFSDFPYARGCVQQSAYIVWPGRVVASALLFFAEGDADDGDWSAAVLRLTSFLILSACWYHRTICPLDYTAVSTGILCIFSSIFLFSVRRSIQDCFRAIRMRDWPTVFRR